MAKPVKNLLIAVLACALLFVVVRVLLKRPAAESTKEEEVTYLTQKNPSEIKKINVGNQNGEYLVSFENGSCKFHDIPSDILNTEYVDMLLDESSSVCFESVANENPEDLGLYGLANPLSTVSIEYTDGSTLKLFFGNEEPVSGGRYFKTDSSQRVLVMKNSRTIRFTMPVEKYINFVIIEPNDSSSILSTVQDITFSGTKLPSPIVLKAVLPDRADVLRAASSFGAVTHLISSPALHEADQTELISVTESLMGLISEGIVDYNCTADELSGYGFDEPVLQVEFDYKNGKDAELRHHILKLSTLDEGYIVTLDEQGVVYKIANVAFTEVSYDKLVSRWFLSPFITDVKAVEVSFEGKTQLFEIDGATAKDITVTKDSKPIDSELFRAYFNLLVSAAAEGELQTEAELSGNPVMTLRYIYKDEAKPDDVMNIYNIGARQVLVEVNGICEFAMREKFVEIVKNATENVANGQIFSSEW